MMLQSLSAGGKSQETIQIERSMRIYEKGLQRLRFARGDWSPAGESIIY